MGKFHAIIFFISSFLMIQWKPHYRPITEMVISPAFEQNFVDLQNRQALLNFIFILCIKKNDVKQSIPVISKLVKIRQPLHRKQLLIHPPNKDIYYITKGQLKELPVDVLALHDKCM